MGAASTETAFAWPVRVYWEDTDGGGVVYHARYLNFFERARTELIRACGIDQMELKEAHNLIWVVLEMNVRFVKAAKLDDELQVSAAFEWTRGVRQGIAQRMTRRSDDALIATAEVTAVMLQADTLRPTRMPAWIKQKMGLEGI
ncbi:MAG: tol-pal system-associated acyl-CoA thioesterase [Xanthomonadales bacterium]